MIKTLVFIFLIAGTSYGETLKIKAINFHNKQNIYDVYDGDFLFSNKDKLQFEILSEDAANIEIEYLHGGNKTTLGKVELFKNQSYIFPKGDNEYLTFDQNGEVEFLFTKNGVILDSFNVHYISAERTVAVEYESATEESNYGLNPNVVISNSRGSKEIEAYNRLVKSTVVVETPNELGSGIVISKDGKILTNYHVVKNQSLVDIAFKPVSKHATKPSKNTYLKARVIKIEPLKDLALLEILDKQALQNLEPIKFSKIDNIDIGEDIYTMGHPQKEYFTIGYGIVSQVRENYSWNGNKARFVIQTQSATSKGNSGGPLLGDDYKLIGLNTFSNTKGQNLNFAISIKDIEEFLAKKEPQSIVIKSSNKAQKYKILSFKKGIDKNQTPIVQYELDSNNNGKRDLIAIDVGDNGVYNYLLFDTDEDGIFDKKSYDKDGDGIFERTERY